MLGSGLFTSLQQADTLCDRVANQIEALIAERKLEVGEALPTERQLGDLLGVSRTVVREAMRVLKVKGLVRVQHGSGVFVTRVPADKVSESISLFLSTGDDSLRRRHLAEVRRLVEIEIAGFASERANADDLASMEREIRNMANACGGLQHNELKRKAFARADVDFHLAIAAATANPLLIAIFRPLIDLLLRQRLESLDRPGALEQGMRYHEDILSAIRRKDAEGARRAMREHLERSAELMEPN